MSVSGTTKSPITKPIIITVEEMASSWVQSHTCNDKERRKQIPQIKANLDKNNSQRINDFRLK